MTYLEHQHTAIWAVIDDIAARREISTSRLAIQSGYDPTAFNRSKRTKGEELRWPTTEAIAKVLQVGRLSYADFGAMVDEKMGR